MFESTEQHVCDQARAIRKNGWLSELELEEIKRQVDAVVLGNGAENEEEMRVDEERTEHEVEGVVEAIGNGEEPRNEVVTNIVETDEEVMEASEEVKGIVDRLKEIMVEGKRSDEIMFKKLDRRALEIQVDKVNKGMKYVKCRTITETNNLIVAGSVWVAEKFGLKRSDEQKEMNLGGNAE